MRQVARDLIGILGYPVVKESLECSTWNIFCPDLAQYENKGGGFSPRWISILL